MLIVPAIDIMGGKVVRLVRGEFDKPISYPLSPLAYAEKWESEGAKLIHVVDLDGAKSGEPKNFDCIKEVIKRVKPPVEVGGGVRSIDAIKRYLEFGAQRVVLSTKVIEDASFLLTRDIKDYLSRVAVSIDIKEMETQEVVKGATAGWLQAGDVLIDIPSFIQAVAAAGVKYVNFSDIAKDGTMVGPDVRKVENFLKVARECSTHPLFFTYAGGISSLDDIKKLVSMGNKSPDAVIVGRALYEDKFSLKDAIKCSQKE